MQRVKLVDVAREAGVHAATASRALNPAARHEVSGRTVRRVEQAAERLGYLPNALARGLRTSRSYVAALVIPDITNPLFPPIVRGAERVLRTAGFTLVLTDTNNDPTTQHAHIASMRAQGVDGLIVATARWSDDLVDDLGAAEPPVVLVNRRTAHGSLPFVGPDDRRGIELCVDHLADLGHRRIVHLAGPDSTSTGRERAGAFRDAMAARQLPVESGSVIECEGFTEAAGSEAARRLVGSRLAFTGIVAANDLLALGAIAGVNGAGRRIPDDVSVTGFNDVAFMDKLTPPLTTVHIPLTEMGEHAARMLLGRIDDPGRECAESVRLAVTLVVRGTTGPVPEPTPREAAKGLDAIGRSA
jgi:LacI family transcriptional regulator, galactose operon repressor